MRRINLIKIVKCVQIGIIIDDFVLRHTKININLLKCSETELGTVI